MKIVTLVCLALLFATGTQAQKEALKSFNRIEFNNLRGMNGYVEFYSAPANSPGLVMRASAGKMYITSYMDGKYNEALNDAGITIGAFRGYPLSSFTFQVKTKARFKEPSKYLHSLTKWYYSEEFTLEIMNGSDEKSVNDFSAVTFDKPSIAVYLQYKKNQDKDLWLESGALAFERVTRIWCPDFDWKCKQAIRDWEEKQRKKEEKKEKKDDNENGSKEKDEDFWESSADQSSSDKKHTRQKQTASREENDAFSFPGKKKAAAKNNSEGNESDDFWDVSSSSSSNNNNSKGDFWSSSTSKPKDNDKKSRSRIQYDYKKHQGWVEDEKGNILIPKGNYLVKSYHDGMAKVWIVLGNETYHTDINNYKHYISLYQEQIIDKNGKVIIRGDKGYTLGDNRPKVFLTVKHHYDNYDEEKAAEAAAKRRKQQNENQINKARDAIVSRYKSLGYKRF
ncbi:hypothetical protein COR50_12575 [Chitinophaga caeni]|uniref:Uncharacterized protein n=1 Tax=Chitinophaga caeni TaxID=2029983 RepID=A0A291QVH3_9BACT|nr:hypothetical protein [Chitinophaga caeni]ATL47935.1 hypothetical protein COR50_12575 [Chitinophaga caeni]